MGWFTTGYGIKTHTLLWLAWVELNAISTKKSIEEWVDTISTKAWIFSSNTESAFVNEPKLKEYQGLPSVGQQLPGDTKSEQCCKETARSCSEGEHLLQCKDHENTASTADQACSSCCLPLRQRPAGTKAANLPLHQQAQEKVWENRTWPGLCLTAWMQEQHSTWTHLPA